ncbi:hypothetical protein GJAV_G00106620 [Gymnothorax javanicus]|nr:hypothetical protein GJAV_G00106620 [Gymnothorax javanicus]
MKILTGVVLRDGETVDSPAGSQFGRLSVIKNRVARGGYLDQELETRQWDARTQGSTAPQARATALRVPISCTPGEYAARDHPTPKVEQRFGLMEEERRVFDGLVKQEFISVVVQDPQLHREDFWHEHCDYEIRLHTNSMYFRRKASCVRRRFSEFVWLRQKLQHNAVLMDLPKLPPSSPFFSLRNPLHLKQRMEGLQHFLEIVLQTPLLLSDSCLHLFLQSDLSVSKMEACASGRTRYSVAQAIQRTAVCRLPSPSDDSDSESTSSSSTGLDHSSEEAIHGSHTHLSVRQ